MYSNIRTQHYHQMIQSLGGNVFKDFKPCLHYLISSYSDTDYAKSANDFSIKVILPSWLDLCKKVNLIIPIVNREEFSPPSLEICLPTEITRKRHSKQEIESK